MKILSWNIERGYKKNKIAKFLKKQAADIYLLTEIDRGVKRTKNADIFRFLLKTLNQKGYFAKEFYEINSLWRKFIPTGGLGGGMHGNAIFTRYPILNYKVINLPTNNKLKWEGKTVIPELFEPRKGNRVAQICKIDSDFGKITLVNTHLENWRSGWPDRKRQLESIHKQVADQKNLIMAGDLNTSKGIASTFLRKNNAPYEVKKMRSWTKTKNVYDPYKNKEATFFLPGLRAKLDWIILSKSIRIKKKKNIKTGLSDHNCLIVEIQ